MEHHISLSDYCNYRAMTTMTVERVGVSSSSLVTRKRTALHHELPSREHWGDDLEDPQECSEISSNASSSETTLLDPGLGHVHHWNISDDPIDLVIHFQRNSHRQHQRRRSHRRINTPEVYTGSASLSTSSLTPVVLRQSTEDAISAEQQAPLLAATTSSSSSPAEEDEYHQVVSTFHRFGMFDTPRRLKYWSESSTPDLPRMARTMLGIFIVVLSFVAFCALVSSRYFSASGRQIRPVIRMLRVSED